MGPTRAQQFLQLREKAGGEVTGSWLCNIGGVDWKDLTDSGKIVVKGGGADVGLLGWVGNKGVLEWGNVPEEVPMDMEKVTSKINEVDFKVEDRFLKHELQMQLMPENMEGIMQVIAHKLDTLEKRVHSYIMVTRKRKSRDGNYQLLMVQVNGGHTLSKQG